MLLADPEADLSGLIAEIYDAALDRSLWPAVLPKATRFVGGQAAALLAKSGPSVTAFYYHGVTPQYMQSYLDSYYRYDTFGVLEAMNFSLCEAITTVDRYRSHDDGQIECTDRGATDQAGRHTAAGAAAAGYELELRECRALSGRR